MVGTTISHYRILEKLGEGGMGVVYKAEDTTLHRTVALKFLPPALLGEEESRARFLNEARATAALHHPAIATIFDIEDRGDTSFIALEYVGGQDLAARLAGGPLSAGEAISIALQVAEGLREAHAKGIVHRDIKCQNIMVTPKGDAKILDFGLARLRGTSLRTRAGITMGTMGYMSPEQLLGGETDHRTDLWAMGVVLYEMIAGKRPFQGEFDSAIAYQVINVPHVPLSSVREGIPPELDRIVSRLMEKEPDRRYPSADELLVDLRAVRSTLEGKTGTVSRRAGRGRRRLLVIAAAAVAVMTAGLLLLLNPPALPANEERSVAVLPFTNLSDQKQDEYFSDGMTDQLINALVRIGGLRVPGRTSVFMFRERKADLRSIGHELHVSTVLDGSVRRSGNRIRVSASLINAADGFTLWADTYEREMKDVFAVQDDITARIVDVLKVRFQGGEAPTRTRTPPNLEAYTLYLRGIYHVNKRSEEDIRAALGYFEKAISSDSTYAQASSGVSEAYVLLAAQAAISPREAYPRALAAAERAVRVDEHSAEAYTSLAHVHLHTGVLQQAGREFARAIQLAPGYAPAHQFVWEYFSQVGPWDSAKASIQRALELGPLDLAANVALATMLLDDGQVKEAIAQLRHTLDLDSNYFLARLQLGNAYRRAGFVDSAAVQFQRAIQLTGGNRGWGALGLLYAAAGKRQMAEEILEKMIRRSETRYTSPREIANLSAALRDRERTLKWLAKARVDDPWTFDTFIEGPSFTFLNDDPRFVELYAHRHEME